MRLFKLVKNILCDENSIKDIDEVIFEKGFEQYKKDGQYNELAYYSMINLFCKTNGEYLDRKHREISKSYTIKKLEGIINSCIGELDSKEIYGYVSKLNLEGYSIFENKIPEDLLKNLETFMLTHKCKYARDKESVVFDQNNILSEVYRFESHDVISNPDVQKLIMDPGLMEIARQYLGCEPIFDFAAMWISTAFSPEASDDAAQLYHFDLDRIKWLKIFVYINDVNEEQGPHYYIEGSHLTGAKPQYLLDRGYVRISDDEILKNYPKNKVKNITGKAGAVFAGDTKCWHKGTPVIKGKRMVLQLEYTANLFGGNVPKSKIYNYSPGFKDFFHDNPYYFTNCELV